MRDLMLATARPAWALAVALGIVGTLLGWFAGIRDVPSATAFDLARIGLTLVIGEVVTIWLAPLALARQHRWHETDDSRNVREALTWCYLPLAASAALWLPILLFTNSQGEPTTARYLDASTLGIVRFGAESICPMWSRILSVAALKEVQRTSWLGAILQFLLARAVTVVVYIVVTMAAHQLF